jgi:predicted dehydrogenase
MAKIRFGVVGLGSMGSNHAKFIVEDKNKDFCLAAVCDIKPAKASEIGDKYKVPHFTDAQEMYDSGLVDAVIVATPHYWHAPLTIQAARSKLHVLCEKPISVSVGHARAMVRECKKQKVQLGVMFQCRTKGINAQMKQMIDRGMLGEIHRISAICSSQWYRSQAYYGMSPWRGTWDGEGGGVLLNQAPHSLDLFQWLGGMPKKIIASVSTRFHNIEVENTANVICVYEGPKVGFIYATTTEAPGIDQFMICGDKGSLLAENGTLKFAKLKGSMVKHLMTTPSTFETPKAEWKDVALKFPARERHINVTRAFAANLLRGSALIATGAEAINQLELTNAVYISGYKNKPVDLPVDAAEMDALLAKLERERSKKQTNLRAASYKAMKKLMGK